MLKTLMKAMLLSFSFVLFAFAAQRGQAPAPTVDHHQHLYSPATVELAPEFKGLAADDLIKLLDQAGIRRAVVLSTAYQFGNPNRPAVENEYEKVKAENDWTSQQVARYSDRLRGFCGVNPLKSYALDEIERCAKDPQLRFGLKFHFGNSDVDLDNPQHIEQLQRVFRSANDHRMAMAIHMRSSITKQRPYGARQAGNFLSEVLPAAPDVPIQIAHLAGGGSYDDPLVDQALSVFAEAVRNHDPRMTHVYFDVSGVTGIGQWNDKVDLVAMRIRQLGIERILYGSDGANGGNFAPKEAWAAFQKLPLTDAEFRTIASNVAPYMK